MSIIKKLINNLNFNLNEKKIVSAVFVAAIAIAAGYTMKQNAEKNDFSDIALANVEALARAEYGEEYCPRLCYTWPGYYCVLETPISYVYCNDRYPY